MKQCPYVRNIRKVILNFLTYILQIVINIPKTSPRQQIATYTWLNAL